MLNEIQFLVDQLKLLIFFLHHDLRTIKADSAPGKADLIWLMDRTQSMERMQVIFIIELDSLYFRLYELRRMLTLEDATRQRRHSDIIALQSIIELSPLLAVFLDKAFDECLNVIQKYASAYRAALPNKSQQVEISIEQFQRISISRFNYPHKIDTLRKGDHRVAGDLKRMISILNGDE